MFSFPLYVNKVKRGVEFRHSTLNASNPAKSGERSVLTPSSHVLSVYPIFCGIQRYCVEYSDKIKYDITLWLSMIYASNGYNICKVYFAVVVYTY